MSNLVPSGGPLLPSRPTRSAAKAVGYIRAEQAVSTTRALAAAELVQDATTAALTAAASIASMEAVLVERVPHAAGDLRAIANASTISLIEVVMRANRGIR